MYFILKLIFKIKIKVNKQSYLIEMLYEIKSYNKNKIKLPLMLSI
jgi:hypothetical protein